MTRDKFKAVLEELDNNKKIKDSDISDFVETCVRLLIYHTHAYDIMKLRTDTKVFNEEGGF